MAVNLRLQSIVQLVPACIPETCRFPCQINRVIGTWLDRPDLRVTCNGIKIVARESTYARRAAKPNVQSAQALAPSSKPKPITPRTRYAPSQGRRGIIDRARDSLHDKIIFRLPSRARVRARVCARNQSVCRSR